MTVFGQIITGIDVERAVKAHIEMWIGDYLAEVGAKYEFARGDLPLFNSYVPALSLDDFEEDQSPACIIVAPGTLSEPEKRAQHYSARWAVGVGAVVSGQNRENTRLLAAIYSAAVRSLMVQKPTVGGFAEGVVWLSERYDTMPQADQMSRTLGAGVNQFGVDVNGLNRVPGGPMTPATDITVDPGDWPEVESVTNTVVPQGS